MTEKIVPFRVRPTGEQCDLFVQAFTEQHISGMLMALRHPEWTAAWLRVFGLWPIQEEPASTIDEMVTLLPSPEKEDVS